MRYGRDCREEGGGFDEDTLYACMKLSNDKKTKLNKKLEPSLASVQALGDLKKEGRTKWRAVSASRSSVMWLKTTTRLWKEGEQGGLW